MQALLRGFPPWVWLARHDVLGNYVEKRRRLALENRPKATECAASPKLATNEAEVENNLTSGDKTAHPIPSRLYQCM